MKHSTRWDIAAFTLGGAVRDAGGSWSGARLVSRRCIFHVRTRRNTPCHTDSGKCRRSLSAIGNRTRACNISGNRI